MAISFLKNPLFILFILMDKIIHIIHIRFLKNNLPFVSYSHLFFVPLQCRRTMIIYVSKHKIFRSHGARDTLLS